METGTITSHIDVAQVVLYAFWIFFAGLIFYLRQEDRREGYPLIAGINDLPGSAHSVLIPEPKTFRLADGRVVTAPNPDRADNRDIPVPYVIPWPGGPILPTTDPMGAGVGPGSWAERADVPDVTFEGHERIVPMRVSSHSMIASGDPDPRGMEVLGADGVKAGTVSEAWVDRSESLIRYFEVDLGPSVSGGKKVLLPVNFTVIDKQRRQIKVDAILARHFANVPGLKKPDSVTLLEEEKIMAYYGSGTLYATPERQEPLV